MNAQSLGRKILSADPAILRVLIVDKNGKELAHVYSKEYPKKSRLGRVAEEKVANLDAVAIAMFQQEEIFYGSLDFILLAYRGSKVMLMFCKKQRVYLAARILRSANAEFLHNKVKPILSQS